MEQPCTSESHDAAKHSPTWSTFHLVGHMPVDCEDHPYTLELRNCPHCHSTLAIQVDATP